ncbi:hypothetical protein [Nocardia alni]|uniref:hypothetical protein n=1 Tax=Nocardia alni TaxID=2815723 RepID=UPI001C24F4CF|nr:hypothetical protein [Nocardia alni]
MKRKLSASIVALAAGAMIAGPMIGTASAAPVYSAPAHQDGGWGGFNNPGRHDPHDPWHQDWRCDRHGFWHNDQHDWWGHRDFRCRGW